MAGYISLESGIRTCKTGVENAERAASARFLNPNYVVAPRWNGYDTVGRPVCEDSFMTKTPGSSSAQDRITVENNVSRPRYFEYITLNPSGMVGDFYGTNSFANVNAVEAQRDRDDKFKLTGNFGIQSASVIRSGCSGGGANRQYAQYNTDMRNRQASGHAANSFAYKAFSGN
jgi:hypothetical protein